MEVGVRLVQIDMKPPINKSGSYLNWDICLCYYNLISVIRQFLQIFWQGKML